MIRAVAFVLALLSAGPALAQGCGSANPNCVVPTPPTGDSSNRAANTSWTRSFLASVVSSLNGLTGNLSIAAGTGTTVTAAGSSVQVGLSSARSTLPTQQIFTSGSGTYTTPANVIWIEVMAIGGGAGGGGGGTTPGNGGSGNNTTFGTLTAGGGASGTGSGGGASAGGTSANCDINISGNPGQASYSAGSTSLVGQGGMGGAGPLGGGGYGGWSGANGSAGINGTGGGGGGGGGSGTSSGNVGAGGGAGAYCSKIINSPAATYSYAVAASVVGGTAGTGGQTGGAGGSGLIRVIEHYGS